MIKIRHALFLTWAFTAMIVLKLYNESSLVVGERDGTIAWNDMAMIPTTRTATSTTTTLFVPPSPPTCSAKDLDKVHRQFSAEVLHHMTGCPNSEAWLDTYLYQTFFPVECERLRRPLVAISLGCNKGDDAVDTLRKLSRNKTFSTKAFRQKFAQYAPQANGATDKDKMLKDHRGLKRACPENPPSFFDEFIENQEEQQEQERPIVEAVVHCVEANPTTAQTLQQTVDSFPHFADKFIVTHGAVGATQGEIYFPVASAGIEWFGLESCAENPAANPHCQAVPAYTIDSFVRQKVVANRHDSDDDKLVAAVNADQALYQALAKRAAAAAAADSKQNPSTIWAQYEPNFVIDFLMVDIEGYDWQALGQGGADWTLRHTRYLEFEYHSVGAWKHDKLSEAVDKLDQTFGFTCYWPGKGELVRITSCFQPYMEFHDFSNVACVNRYLQPHLAGRMELLYQETLAKYT